MPKLITPTRRQVLAGAGAFAAAGTAAFSAVPALAKAAFKKNQAPAFFRFKLGKFEITMASDGHNITPVNFGASNIPLEQLKAYLHQHYYSTERRFSHLNVCLINTGEKVVLIDSGSGDNFRDSTGKLTASLEAAGYQPEDVDIIVITHGHPDHIWGIIDDFAEEPRFPNASYYINEPEWAYWTADDIESKMPQGFKFFATGALRNLKPVGEQTKRIKAGAEIIPGIHTLDSPGHTHGHISVIVESEGKKLLVTGDAITHPFISFEHPDWQPAVDMDKDLAVKSRKRLIDMAATDRLLLASYHIPFPGVGHVAKDAIRYKWVPITWEWAL